MALMDQMDRKGTWGYSSGLFDQSVLRAVLVCVSAAMLADAQGPTARDLTEISLEDLMNVQVTSVSKKEQKLSKTPAAVYVINPEDIRRSGARNIPDLLRMVPGVEVAKINATSWAISIRGFSDLFANKVLVLVDGRSAYRSIFSGVQWDEMEMPLENIERIEVIRGPGGTVWGANAMNGVINIITKSAKDTKGGLISAGSGSQTTAEGTVQWGGAIGSRGSYRAFGRYFNIDNSISETGGHATDGWHGSHAGFRSDWDLTPQDTLTVQGDFLETEEGQRLQGVPFLTAPPYVRTINDKVEYSGGNVLGRWGHTLSNGSVMELQFYDDHFSKRSLGAQADDNTLDLDFQHHLAAGSRNDVVWGLGYRVISETILPGSAVAFLPPYRTDNLYSAFVQDEIRITNGLSLTLGAKFEHNAYTGFELEPSAQLVWDCNKRQMFWASAAKAIRQPARSDFDVAVNSAVAPLGNGNFGLVQLRGSQHPKAEELRDFEIGHRAQITKRLSVDSAAFLGLYRRVTSEEPEAPLFTMSQGRPLVILPFVFDNKAHGTNYGLEVFASWKITDRWRLSPGLSLLHTNIREGLFNPGQPTQNPLNNPRHQFEMRSLLNLTRNLEWDNSLSYAGAIATVPGYTRLDTRFGWHVGESVELSLIGQNLLTPRHLEFPNEFFIAHTQVERSVDARITWHF